MSDHVPEGYSVGEAYELGKKHGRLEAGGAVKKADQHKRKIQVLSDEISNHLVKNRGLRHEIKRLEDTLTWIHRTAQPIEEIRNVIERTIPRKFKNE